MLAVLTIGVLLWPASSGCRAVAGDRIAASDLAAEFEVFASLPGDTEIALSPAPGARRLFSSVEIERLARRHGVELSQARPVCFTRNLAPLGEGEVRAALEASLTGLGARLELADFVRAPVPTGKIEFPRSGLGRAAAGGRSLWRGMIRYGAGRTYPVWARVRVNVERPRVVALRTLAPGRPIEPDAVEIRLIEGYVFEEPPPSTVAEVAGKIPRRTIQAGQPIGCRTVDAAREVDAGAMVEVEVRSGAARLGFDAKAEAGGRTGDSIMVRNPSTGKRFRAVVEGKGKVSVDEVQISAGERSGGGGRLGSQEAR